MQIGDETDGLPAGLDAGAEAYVTDNSESKSMDPPVQIEPLLDHGSAGIYGHALQHGPGLDSVRDPRGDQDQALNESIQDQEISSSDPPATSCKKDLQETFSRFRSKSEGSRLGFPRKGLLKKNSDPDGIKLHRRVSFADSNGLELEEIRSFEQPTFDLEDQPELDFLLPACTNSATTRSRVSGERRFVPYFTLPWSQPGKHSVVFAALEDRKVCLETLTINSSWRMSGTILVKNLSFDKHVFVRRTLDKWHTYNDLDASYVCSVNENVDRFRFELHFAFKLPPGTRLEIALGYNVGHGKGQYWDNNSDNNYAFWFNDKV